MNSRPVPGACPSCGTLVTVPAPGAPTPPCYRCGLPQDGPVAAELRHITVSLAAVEAERHRLLGRRAQLLAPPRPATAAFGPAGPRPAPPAGGEARGVDVQNVLLSLGGVLLAVAAVAFTVISWGHLGIGGRALVLAVLTLAATAVPAVLLRRSLTATSEVAAGLGLVLLLLDSYALRRVVLTTPGPDAYAAGATAVVAALWGGYAWLLRGTGGRPGLRLPAPFAFVLAQFPLVFAALAARSATALAAALLADAAAGTALAVLRRPALPPYLRPTAAVTAAITGVACLVVALPMSVDADGFAGALRAAALLTGTALCALTAARRAAAFVAPAKRTASQAPATAPWPPATASQAPATAPQEVATPQQPGARETAPQPSAAEPPAPGPLGVFGPPPATLPYGAAPPAPAPVRHDVLLGALAGLLVALAAGGVLRQAVPAAWQVPGYAGCAAVLLGVVVALRRAGRREGPVNGAGFGQAVVLAVAVLWSLGPLLVAMLAPLAGIGDVWPASGAAAAGRIPHWSWSDPAAAVVTAAGAAGIAALAARRWPRRAVACHAVALALATAAAGGLPAALNAAYPTAVTLRVATAAALLLTAALHRSAPVARGACAAACAVAVTAAGWSLADRTTTCAVLAVLTALFAAAAVPAADFVRRSVAGSMAVGFGAALTWAAPAAAGLPARDAAFAVLAVGALAQLAAVRAPLVAVECAGCAVAALAAGSVAGRPGVLAGLLGTAGLVAAAVALRPARRRAGTATAAVLLLLAGWVRMAASGVDVPEAYTAPLTAVALVLGVLARRREPSTGSWQAYGPGLAVTLLPSLVTSWADPGWPRPLLLGAGALAVTLAGARYRLMAPLVLGGGVLLLDALHELAPYVLQVLGLVPRWMPLAAAGALLLALGATYEHRLRDARRLREALLRLG